MKTKQSSRSSGFISFGCLGYLLILGLIIGGAQGTYTALKNRNRLEITVTDYLATKPDAEWVMFKNATLNLLDAAHMERFGKISEVFIPLQDGETAEGAPIHILMSTKDEEIIAALSDLNAAGQSEEKVLEAAMRNASKLFMQRDVSGLIQFGIESNSKTRGKLEKLNMNLAKGFVILEEGEQPALGRSAGMLTIGLALAVFVLLRGSKKEGSPPPIPGAN